MRRPLIALASTLALGTCACDRMAPRPSTLTSAADYASAEPMPALYVAGRVAAAPSSGFTEQRQVAMNTTPLPPLRLSPPETAPAMVIRTGQATIEVDSLEPALDLVRRLADAVGGAIANTVVRTGQGQLRTASLELKIPAGHFDEAVSGLSPIGKVEVVTIDAQDVGEEYVDVTARMSNARRLEQRLIGILASRTAKLEDVLEVEQALARVREEIERYEGRIRYLRAHAAVSTLTITLHEPRPVVGQVGVSLMGEAFKQSWRNFVWLLALVVQSLGIVLPLGTMGVAGWVLVRRWRKPHPVAPREA